MTTEKLQTAHRGTPPAEVHIDAELVRALLRQQHADLANLPLLPAESGWDNAMYRLGETLAVRLPRRSSAAELVAHEQRWLSMLAPELPLPTPVPVRIGMPGCGYPWSWSVVPWISGVTADVSPASDDQALPLVQFLRALHRPAPSDAPRNAYRGVMLAERRGAVEERMQRLQEVTELVTPAIQRIWEQALAAPMDVEATWVHSDLHARNVLVNDGRISGVIDWGDVAAGDRATDLASIWMLLESKAAREIAMNAYGASDATWARAKGWAVFFGTVLLDTGLADNPRHAHMGERVLQHLAEGP